MNLRRLIYRGRRLLRARRNRPSGRRPAEEPDELAPASKLIRLPNAVSGPALSEKITKESGFTGFDLSAPPDEVIERLHITIEAQRRDEHPGLDRHFIGGFAQLTTITPTGIEQRILTRWDEDKIGELIRPRPIDWAKWREEHLQTKQPAIPAGLSPLRRRMLEKKQRKGTLRAAA